jgi:LemA protein
VGAGAGIAWLLGAGVIGLVAWAVDRRRRAFTDLATTPAAAVFAGRNEVKGRAWAAEPLTSRRTQSACGWWRYTLEEERVHTRTVTSTDSQGHSHTRTETYTQWHKIDEDGGTLDQLEVVDDTGSVAVALGGAHVEPRELFNDIFREEDGRGFLAKMFDFDNRTGRYREIERGITVGDELFVVGEALLDDQRGVPYLADALVSTRSEESRTQWLGVAVWFLVLLGVGLAAAGSAVVVSPSEPALPVAWLPGVGAACFVLVVAWTVTMYNRLRLLSQAVGRATALIDVQLKRRHDLVPALARVVAAHADHEQSLLSELTEDRSAPSDASTQTAELRRLLAVAEAYPELTANESFLNLQRQLADTEARIAGSRTFYNDTVTLLHNLSGRFPGLLVARFVPHAKANLEAAEGFERTVPAIERAFA